MNNKDLVLKQTSNYMDTLIKRDITALPTGFNPLRFKQNAITVLSETAGIEKLQGNEYTLARTLMKGAYLGLDFFNKECYCIVYGNKAEFQTDYKGEIKLAKKYSINPIKDIYAKLVREGDLFEEEIINGKQTVNFKPKSFNDGEIIGAFAVCLFHDGSMNYETMSKAEIETVRKNFSKMPNGQAWSKSTGEMYKKTVLRRLCKLIELDFDSIEQRKVYEETLDSNINNKPKKKEKSIFESDEVVETEFTEVNDQPDKVETQSSIFDETSNEMEGDK